MSFFINEALNVLPEEIKFKALKNHYEYCNSETGKKIDIIHTKVGSISQALTEAFIWKHSPEGFIFWHNIYLDQLNLEEKTQKIIKSKLNKLN